MSKKHASKSIAVAGCVAELAGQAPSEILLVPAGEFRARDGRPKEVKAWRLDGAAAARVIARAEALAGDFVADYEHQTLHAEKNGRPAPAAGWFKKLEWREGSGLHAVDVRWTAKARARIEAEEYRYVSPVFEYDKLTGEVLAVLMAALTNYPALDGHSDLAARAAARFSTAKEDQQVNREKLIAVLGLAANASDEQIEQAVAALKGKAGSVEGKDGEIAALKAAADKPDPAKFVPLETFESLKTEVAALRSQQVSGEVAALVKQGLEEGKLLPAQQEWAAELGKKDVAALKGYLEKTPAIAALKGETQTGGRPPAGEGVAALTGQEAEILANLGVSAEDYRKYNPAEK